MIRNANFWPGMLIGILVYEFNLGKQNTPEFVITRLKGFSTYKIL
jgi:hypothetical protein